MDTKEGKIGQHQIQAVVAAQNCRSLVVEKVQEENLQGFFVAYTPIKYLKKKYVVWARTLYIRIPKFIKDIRINRLFDRIKVLHKLHCPFDQISQIALRNAGHLQSSS
mmetsp:Transcript_19096/g.25158  ORF Transcript_19096/g.25158 Transcript_19096/m.25158 type:complete len:108 (-) Transcript_19096:123-446(-)